MTLPDKGNYSAINSDLERFAAFFLIDLSKRSVEANWLLFKNKMLYLFAEHAPTITVTEKKSFPWFNATLARLNNKKKRLFRSAKRSNSACAWNRYYAAEKEFDKLANNEKLLFFSQKFPAMLRNNPKKFWHIINPSTFQPLVLHNDQNHPIPNHETTEQLNSFFSSVFSVEPVDNLPSFLNLNHSEMPDITICSNGIAKLIDSLKLTSSCGIEGINAKMLKNVKSIASTLLCHIFQQSLSSEVVPDD